MIRRRLNYCWRVVATGLCFAVFGIGGVVLTLIATPFLWLLVHPAAKRKRQAQRLISLACRCFVGLMHRIGVMDYHISGREHLRHPGALVVANHPSLIDALFLIGLMPEVDCVVNERLWRNPFTGGPVRLAGYISNGCSGPELVARCQASLQAGYRLIIFPEGTRTQPGQPLHFQRGAAHIAVHAAADVVPVTLIFDQTTLTKGEPWYHVPSRKLDINIRVEAPIDVQPYLRNGVSQPLAARQLTTALYDYYTTRLAQAGRLPENDTRRS